MECQHNNAAPAGFPAREENVPTAPPRHQSAPDDRPRRNGTTRAARALPSMRPPPLRHAQATKAAYAHHRRESQRRKTMLKLLAVSLVGLSLVAAPAVAQMKDAPKTKADCEKVKDMKWDGKACVKK
jgi:hypothetical protein